MATSIIPHRSLELLWANSNTNTTFNPQTISIDISKYTALVITYLATSSDAQTFASIIPVANPNGLLSACTAYNRWRGFSITGNGITFSDGRETPTYGTPVTNEDAVIPYSIYGIV